jgi:hypothetical protein
MEVLFRACPRCSGDLQRSEDLYGHYDKCLQCGHRVEALGELAFAITPAAEKTTKRAKKTSKADAA